MRWTRSPLSLIRASRPSRSLPVRDCAPRSGSRSNGGTSNRAAGVVTVERVYSQRRLKQCAKTSRQRRRVPLRQRVLDALDAMPPRLDSPLLFPAARGGHIDLKKFRHRQWVSALRAAGIAHRRIYDLRHTYATWSVAAGVDLFTLSRRMGTSLAMIDATYGHLASDADERKRTLLDTYDAAVNE
jgi:integrase